MRTRVQHDTRDDVYLVCALVAAYAHAPAVTAAPLSAEERCARASPHIVHTAQQSGPFCESTVDSDSVSPLALACAADAFSRVGTCERFVFAVVMGTGSGLCNISATSPQIIQEGTSPKALS